MSEDSPARDLAEKLPEAEVQPKKGFSIVWLVPLLALAIGGWLVYKAWSEKGPTVMVSFKTAEGLQAGKTKVKYKDVEIGQVEEINLSKDISQVDVKLQMAAGIEPYLTEETRFWVVRARVAAGKVSGLGTIFSGAYIGIDPVQEGKPSRNFVGLEEPPLVTADVPGKIFNLKADSLGSLEIGSPVYFRQIQVGQVVHYGFDETGQAIDLKVFIRSPHDLQVTENTRFWNSSGIDMTMDATGIKVDTQSLMSIMIGGVAFDERPNTPAAPPAPENSTFRLYANKEATVEESYTLRNYYLIYFNQSVRGLSIGAPVEFRGIKLGEVIDIKADFSDQSKGFRIPVTVAIEPERFYGIGSTNQTTPTRLGDLIRQGLHAVLRSGNLLTGQLFVDLEFFPEEPTQDLAFEGETPIIPSRVTELKEIAENIAVIVKKIEQIPFDQLGEDLHHTAQAAAATMKQVELLTRQFNAETAPAVTEALEQLKSSLVDLEAGFGKESPVNYQLRRTLSELSATTRSLRGLTDYLERHPESLIYGKGGSQP